MQNFLFKIFFKYCRELRHRLAVWPHLKLSHKGEVEEVSGVCQREVTLF